MDFFGVLRDQYTKLPISLTEDTARGRTYIVTGSNVGLGFECVKHLVRLRAGRVIMAVRNTKAGNDAARAIEVASGKATSLEVWELDLASYASVQAFVKRAERDLNRLDAVIENAAMAASSWVDGEDGFDVSMTVNVASTMLLTVLLIPLLRESGKKTGTVPRIGIIGSGVAFMDPSRISLDKIDKGNMLADLGDRKKWEGTIENFYPFSKLLLFFCYQQLAAATTPIDSSGVIISYINPGLCYTSLNRNAPTFSATNIQVVVGRVLMGRTAEMGSRTLLHGAVAGEECHGSYVSECVAKDQYIPAWVTDDAGRKAAAQCWREMVVRLENIVPGCVDKALKFR